MKATNAKTTPVAQAETATDAGATAVVPAAPSATSTQDEHAGQGGLYTRLDGQRVLTDRTATTTKEAQ